MNKSSIAMHTHTWVEQYKNTPAGPELEQAVKSAVQFDFGDTDDIPMAKGSDFIDARPPFDNCVLQFSMPNAKDAKHLLILWRTQADESVDLMCAWKFSSTNDWRTINPRKITRTADGFHYEGVGYKESELAMQTAHAMALNAFYVMGCSNVRLVDHAAPDALNKKRERSGKFPILSHKTLTVVTDAARGLRSDGGGTHSSPRVHLRRGHIRHLDDVRRTWVQSCVVGSKHGMVTKDYQVTTRGSSVAK